MITNKVISVFEEEFIDECDSYFADYEINKNDLLMVNDNLPISLSAFIYWILTKDNIYGLSYDNKYYAFELFLSNDTVIYKSDNHEQQDSIIISEELTIQQQFDEIKNTMSKFNPDLNSVFIQEFDVIFDVSDIYNIIDEQISASVTTNKVKYNMNGSLVQKSILKVFVDIPKYEYNFDIENLYANLYDKALKNVYQIINNGDIILILGKIIVKQESFGYREPGETVYEKAYYVFMYEMLMYPINFYNTTSVGQEIDILNGYCGSWRNIVDIRDWALKNYDITNDDIDELCNDLRQKIVSNLFN